MFFTAATQPTQPDYAALAMVGVLAVIVVIMVIRKSIANKKAAAEPISVAAPSQPAAAPGSAGQIKLNNVDPRTAAMVMAIVADKLEKPLNELRFISIKEVS